MRNFTAEQYEALIEHSQNPFIQEFAERERDFIQRIPDVHNRTFVDLGAGHGRATPDLATLGRNVVAIEINPNMYSRLEERAREFSNVATIQGDILNLPEILEERDIIKPVFLLLQNTLGTIEGDYRDVLSVAVTEARKRNGELLLSLLRSNVLGNLGLEMYAGLRDMVGEVNLEQTEPERGWFRSKTGYVSKWWYDRKIEEFRKMGKVEDEVLEPGFVLMRLSF